MGYGSSGKGEPFRRAVGEELVTCYKEVVELLIANDAKVNGKTDDDGYTPLDLAIKNKREKIVDLLRKHGGKTAKEMKSDGR